ncbi:glycosyltransferase family 1 protein [Breznakiella homolactica]|uniref:Glycosyltransferase family 1 protein n=1 Tax=Breznakiella homolactica TaxID=2798577 RepID=A0A7T8BC51_9SPIR|nr:glycosyltransferase family 1 protein [Breznakiella homolactica]QQO10790.1 glycosyltransferase family 1 protein [Breznakiella homolactica]
MRIALVHYHLRRGGVTSVIRHQAKVLTESGDDVLVITGEINNDTFPYPQAQVEELQYDRNRGDGAANPEETAARIAGRMVDAMKARWGKPADVVHIHNPLIQKNSALLPALHILNDQGIRLLLQNHDLAEDFRPDVYISRGDYPENCHYGVINSRDFSFLRRAGLDSAGLHLLPNEVVPVKAVETAERTRYLYPVRAIRRKNIGEALLLSFFIPRGRTVAVTLPPTTRKDETVYRHWKDLAESLHLPVEFEVGMEHDFSHLMGSAVSVITTSVKEGFGFSFLEPWTAGRAVMGRRIDYVCSDFEEAGVRFDSLYSSIEIPMVYLSPPVLRKKMERALSATYEAFRLEPPSYVINMMADDIVSHNSFDFGRLDEELQTGIIRTLAANSSALRDIADVNPFLQQLPEWTENPDLIADNREAIMDSYGEERISGILKNTYRQVMENNVVQRLSKTMLLELYLDPLKLSLVGVGHE